MYRNVGIIIKIITIILPNRSEVVGSFVCAAVLTCNQHRLMAWPSWKINNS